MKPGFAFLTKDLDRKRAEQREQLRKCHDWWLRDLAISEFLPPDNEVDRAYLEVELRRLADEERTELSPLLEEMEVAESAFLVGKFLQKNEVSTKGMSRQAGDPFGDRASELTTIYRTKSIGQLEEGDDRGNSLLRWIVLLLWADELADDGYRDPRFNDLFGKKG